MEMQDDDLARFEEEGAAPLRDIKDQGYVEHDGAQIWYAAYGTGSPVIPTFKPGTSVFVCSTSARNRSSAGPFFASVGACAVTR